MEFVSFAQPMKSASIALHPVLKAMSRAISCNSSYPTMFTCLIISLMWFTTTSLGLYLASTADSSITISLGSKTSNSFFETTSRRVMLLRWRSWLKDDGVYKY